MMFPLCDEFAAAAIFQTWVGRIDGDEFCVGQRTVDQRARGMLTGRMGKIRRARSVMHAADMHLFPANRAMGGWALRGFQMTKIC